MRIERWYWLPIFCVISLFLHATLTLVRGSNIARSGSEPGSIEVAFEPAAPAPKPEPKLPNPEPKAPSRSPRPTAVTPPHRFVAVRRVNRPVDAPTYIRPMRVTHVQPIPVPVTPKEKPVLELPEKILTETPVAGERHNTVRTAPPRIRIAKNDVHPVEGGGSPSPSPIPGGSGGLKAPEAPKEDVNYSGGGRGGENVLHEPPRIGGGGGQSILSVKGDNPLGDTIPDDKPGIGPGSAGGLGNGNGGGVGSGKDKGVGTRLDGRVAIGTLRHKPGPGIGAADSGSNTGTKPPGGGRNTGSELPGTGGTGNGYQRGHGDGVGDGTEGGPSPAKMRGVPFGDVAGLLGGDGGGKGGGTPGRGGVFGSRLSGGGGGPIHIIYALDISGSMRDGNKIGKAQQALIVALGQLRPSDTFNIILFKRDASTFAPDSVPASLANIANARSFVESLRIGDGTNISAAMDLAFGMNGITHIYLMSDGEPNGGIGDFNELRRFIKDKNANNVKIDTLALGLGENFPGIRLLRGIAEDNSGSFHYINLARIGSPSN